MTQIVRENDQNSKRDYSKEAVEFFEKKLEQYGVAEVPLKSLLGHRSQASPEIRHVSGQHAREFKEFLCKCPEIFVVREEHVVLKAVLDKVEASGGGRNSITRVPEETPLDPYLAQQFITILENEIVHLLPQCPNGVQIDSLLAHVKTSCEGKQWSMMAKSCNDLVTFLKMNSKIFHVQANMVTLTAERTAARAIERESQKENISLTLTSPPLSSPSSLSSTPVSSPSRVNSASSFHQRIRSQIIKAVSDNSQVKYRNLINANNNNKEVNLQSILLRNTKIITKSKEGEELISEIVKRGCTVAIDCEGVNLSSSGTVTLLQVAVMPEVAHAMPKTYIFDVLVNPDFLANGLRTLCESEAVVKVIHDVRNDSAALFFQHQITLRNVFDTQIGHSVIQQQNTGRPAYKSKYVSLNTLCELYGGPTVNVKKDQMKKAYRRDPKFWSHRPLTDEMIYYAAFDVFALIPDVYQNMVKGIKPEYVPLLEQLNYEAIFARIKPDEVKTTKKQRKIEMEVTDLKHKLYNSEAKQIVLSNREIRLLR